tara:strand:- start:802 stop:3036 length:2235 start_codon:yes stop_codon:yes gene_type:complete
MPLTKLQFQPGINKETTSYSNEGGWFDMDKVRFRAGYPEKIGGWTKVGINSFLGSCRALHAWRTIALDNYVGLGTSEKYYIESGQGYYDITPIRLSQPPNENVSVNIDGIFATGEVGEVEILLNLEEVTGQEATGNVGRVGIQTNDDVMVIVPDSFVEQNETFFATGEVGEVTISGNIDTTVTPEGVSATGEVSIPIIAIQTLLPVITFSATNASNQITVTHANHGAVAKDFVTFTNAVSLGGNITAAILNQEYEINEIVDDNSYKILARQVASLPEITVNGVYTPTTVAANSSDTGNGGDNVTGDYQINNGLESAVYGNGWGAGTWSRGAWGSAATVNLLTDTLRLWSHDNFGEDLIINVHNGGIFYWDASATNAITLRAVPLSSLTGASNTPTVAAKIIVSDVDRHVIAFGCNPLGSSTQDPLLIRFSDQENAADWTPTTTNTAGDLIVGSGSRIVTAVETRQQTLVFTDVSVHSLQFLGAPFTFGINMISENITVASPNSAIAVEDNVYWMGKNEFYAYTGQVQKLPCTVKDFVFSDFNENQSEKIFASSNTSFSEIWWFYPSADSTTIDRYVIYNYVQNIWYYGNLARGAWLDRGIQEFPIAAGLDGYLYLHENGFDDGSTAPASAISAHIESSQFDIGDGNNFSFVNRLIPDVTFRNSSTSTPSVTFTMKTRNFPGGNYLETDDETISKTASVPVEQFTNQTFVRLRGRSMALRVASTETGMTWRLGSPRLDIRQDGRR